MSSRFIQLQSVTRENRHEMISRVKQAIHAGGGYLVDFHMFSNAAICLNFEVSAGNVGKLYSSLVATGLRLHPESHDLLKECCNQAAPPGERDRNADVVGTLNITFIHNEPDLKIDVPPIPG